jgi:hypothetical protein
MSVHPDRDDRFDPDPTRRGFLLGALSIPSILRAIRSPLRWPGAYTDTSGRLFIDLADADSGGCTVMRSSCMMLLPPLEGKASAARQAGDVVTFVNEWWRGSSGLPQRPSGDACADQSTPFQRMVQWLLENRCRGTTGRLFVTTVNSRPMSRYPANVTMTPSYQLLGHASRCQLPGALALGDEIDVSGLLFGTSAGVNPDTAELVLIRRERATKKPSGMHLHFSTNYLLCKANPVQDAAALEAGEVPGTLDAMPADRKSGILNAPHVGVGVMTPAPQGSRNCPLDIIEMPRSLSPTGLTECLSLQPLSYTGFLGMHERYARMFQVAGLTYDP